jgi:radical SAM protein (TIGR01212 family)
VAREDCQIVHFPGGKRYNSYNEYFRRLFGGRVQKLSVNAGFTCPNRDGTKGTGGCTFCDNDAIHPSYCSPVKPIRQQLEEGKQFHAWRYRRSISYLAYFQPFSNTYAPVERLSKLYHEALEVEGITGLVIGTRPDCVNDEILDYLAHLSESHYIMLEFGIESVNDDTLKTINRGHDFSTSVRAIESAAKRGIRTGAHLIFGLPGETLEMMIKTAGVISSLPLQTIKFHQLQIVRGTPMEAQFQMNPGEFVSFTMPEYISFIIRFIEMLNPAIVIERFAGEVPPRFLAENRWERIRYDAFARLLEAELERLDSWQGKNYM